MFAKNRSLALLTVSLLMMTAGIVTAFAQDKSWDGVWTGIWEDNNAVSSIVIANGRVQQYRYANQAVPIQQQKNTANAITFGCSNSCTPYNVVLTRTGPATAAASFSSPKIKPNRARFSRN